MITIDGSKGECGGQMVRNSCALAIVTGQPVRITNIRARRSKPGLMRQHVTAIQAAATISAASVEGLGVGASEIVFRPGAVVPGDYHFAVGTAGSTGLVLQTVLMPLLLAGAPSRLVLEGGTHNMLAPPFDFIDRSFLPFIERMGPRVTTRLVRHGFYPRGGGRIVVEITPAPLQPVHVTDRGAPGAMAGEVRFAGIAGEVGRRMRDRTARALPDWPNETIVMRQLPADEGPGIILMLSAAHDAVTEVVSAFGQIGVPAERLAVYAAARMQGYLDSGAVAGPYLADQLVLPMALAGGGSVTTVKPSQHLLTAIDIARCFTGRRLAVERQPDGRHLLAVS